MPFCNYWAVPFLLSISLYQNANATADTPHTYPEKSVRIVVSYPPGGTTDTVARLVAGKLSENLGQTFYVDNRPGATGTIGTLHVARSLADGYTLLANDTTYSMLPNLFANLPWDHEKGIVPIAMLVTTPVVLLVPVDSSYKTLQDMIAAARAQPGKLNYGSGGPGSSTHFSAALFASLAGIKMTHIPYKGGGEAMLALMANQVDMLIDAPPTAMPFIQSGKTRALAISSRSRINVLPSVPTFAQAGFPDYTVASWFGLAAPQGIDPVLVNRLHSEVSKVLRDPDLSARLIQLGVDPEDMGPEDFAHFIRTETERWRSLAQQIGVQPQ